MYAHMCGHTCLCILLQKSKADTSHLPLLLFPFTFLRQFFFSLSLDLLSSLGSSCSESGVVGSLVCFFSSLLASCRCWSL